MVALGCSDWQHQSKPSNLVDQVHRIGHMLFLSVQLKKLKHAMWCSVELHTINDMWCDPRHSCIDERTLTDWP